MSDGVLTALIGLLGVALTAAVGLATGLTTSRATNRKNAADTYASLVDDVREFADARLADAEKRAAADQKVLEERLGRMEKKMERLQARLDVRDRQMDDAVQHIWQLRALVPGTPPEPPESIARIIREG